MAAGENDGVKLPRISKGKRSQFYQDPAVDQLMTCLLEVMAETAALRERMDTIERVLDQKGSVSRDDIENFQPTPEVEAERSAWNASFIRRVMRLHETRDV
ncbi:hypothetical protein MB02_10390 [Croceicoccus estronivorus]|uniref:hypothetical protein n=1 Tax=Croceicoccus estronivorus TaxID=1172626 RepID=UPI00082F2799|nr:hypothetical protein [Croceicoccus estronivorus]OCC23575.1 hypothetical protein MB02_10390 [Croceicoccus estronivorus]